MSDHICVSCNMCCDGTIFGYVGVTQAEQDRLGGGPDFSDVQGRRAMRQACTRLGSDGCCTKYDIRPQKCRDFNCAMLMKMESGDVDEPFARYTVDHAKALRARALETFHNLIPAEHLGDDPTNARRCMNALQEAVRNGADIPAYRVELAERTYLMFAMLLSEHFGMAQDVS